MTVAEIKVYQFLSNAYMSNHYDDLKTYTDSCIAKEVRITRDLLSDKYTFQCQSSNYLSKTEYEM
jgi:hypothetical protein